MNVDSFRFYRSFYESIKGLSAKDQSTILRVIPAYVFDGLEPTGLNLICRSVWILIKPNIDSSITKQINGNKGGRPKKETTGYAESETIGYAKDKTYGYENSKSNKEEEEEEEEDKERDKEEEEEEEEEEDGECPPLPPKGVMTTVDDLSVFDGELREAVGNWFAYKAERRQPYKPTGRKSLITEIQNNAGKYGGAAVAAVIRQSMSSNYQGIVWDRLKTQAERSRPQRNANPFLDML